MKSPGVVTAVGSKVTKHKIGDKVGVGCFVDSCRTCPECKRGIEQYCTVQTIWTYNARDKEGTPTYGGYSDRIVVDENYALRMPKNLAARCVRSPALRGHHAVFTAEAVASRPRARK